MERNAITELEQLTLNNRSKFFLKEISKWAKFLSILGFVFIGVMVILSISANAILLFAGKFGVKNIPENLGIAFTAIYLVIAFIYFLPNYYLFKFSVKMKRALITKNDDILSEALEFLKSHYKFIGVFTVIALSLYLLLFVVSLLGVFSSF